MVKLVDANLGPEEEEQFRQHAEAMFDHFIATNGRSFEPSIVASHLGAAHECWTNAWKRARKNPRLSYVEGFVMLPHPDPAGMGHPGIGSADAPHSNVIIHRHAFCVGRDDKVVEVTGGYDNAMSYAGVILNLDLVTELREEAMKGEIWHASVLQSVLPSVAMEPAAKDFLQRLMGL